MSFLFASCFSLGPLMSLLNIVTSPTYFLLPGIQVESCLFSTLSLPASVLRKPTATTFKSHPKLGYFSHTGCQLTIHEFLPWCYPLLNWPLLLFPQSEMKSFKQIPFSSAEPSEALGAVSQSQMLSVRLCSLSCTSLSPQLWTHCFSVLCCWLPSPGSFTAKVLFFLFWLTRYLL